MIDLASKMLSDGSRLELMPQEDNPDSPITAYRYHSLCAYKGDDDTFSSDFSEDQLKQRLVHMSDTPTLIMFSMGDENVPDYVDEKALVDRKECVEPWVQKRSKLNMDTTLYPTESRKLSKPSWSSSDGMDPRGGRIHGNKHSALVVFDS